jgi:hypothetical protein
LGVRVQRGRRSTRWRQPTPDQDIVDDIGRAVGNEYQDTEELKGADKIAKRDKHRWNWTPASAEDYDDRK